MDKYKKDKKFIDLYKRIIWFCEKSKSSTTHLFYDYDHTEYDYKKYMKEFITEYKNDLCLDDFLEMICKPLEKRHSPKPIELLLDLVEHYNTPDYQKIQIIEYIYDVYPEQIFDNKYKLCNGLKSIINPEKWLESMELFSDEKYNWIREEFLEDSYDSKYIHIYNRYFERCTENKIYKEENSKMKEEIEGLKKKIEELELHLKYMPGGEGYLEAKEHLESLINE
jgi:hypothetical protein